MRTLIATLALIAVLAIAPQADAQVSGYYGPRGRVVVQYQSSPSVVVGPSLTRGQARRMARRARADSYYAPGPSVSPNYTTPNYTTPNHAPPVAGYYNSPRRSFSPGYRVPQPYSAAYPGFFGQPGRYRDRDDYREAREDYYEDLEDRREDYQEWLEDRQEDQREYYEDLREEREDRLEDLREEREDRLEDLRERQREARENWRDRFDD